MPPSRRRTSKAETPGLQIDLDGKSYIVRESDISPHDIRALRAATGFSWSGLGRELQKDPDLDLIAALVWFARHLDGESVSYDAVLDDLSYDSDLKVDVQKPAASADEAASPEA